MMTISIIFKGDKTNIKTTQKIKEFFGARSSIYLYFCEGEDAGKYCRLIKPAMMTGSRMLTHWRPPSAA